jgi:hypothetical protein
MTISNDYDVNHYYNYFRYNNVAIIMNMTWLKRWWREALNLSLRTKMTMTTQLRVSNGYLWRLRARIEHSKRAVRKHTFLLNTRPVSRPPDLKTQNSGVPRDLSQGLKYPPPVPFKKGQINRSRSWDKTGQGHETVLIRRPATIILK